MSAATIADRRVHPLTIGLRVLRDLPRTVLAGPAVLAFMSDIGLWRAFALAGLIALVMLFFTWLGWSRFRYGIGERELVIESGILHRNRRTIPFESIQDVDIEQKLLERLVGLFRLRVETGGGGKDEGLIDSVRIEEAERLRGAIRAGKSKVPPATDGAPAESRVLFAMGLPRVFLAGLFNFSLVFLAGLFAFLQTFDRLLPFDIYDPARWIGLVDRALPQRFAFQAVAAVLLMALVLGVVAGMLGTLAREFGFRLTAEPGRLRRVRGMFTRSEAALSLRRLQVALLRSGPMRRAFGFSELFFQSLGAGTDGGGRQSAAPLARDAEIDPILAETGRFRRPEPGSLAVVSRWHSARNLVKLVPVATILIMGVAFRPAFYPALVLIPLLAGAAILARRHHRFGLDDGLLFVARGVWRRRLWIVPARHVQGLALVRSPLQRTLGLATLAVDTAGARATGGPAIVDLRLDSAEALARAVMRARSQVSGKKSGTER